MTRALQTGTLLAVIAAAGPWAAACVSDVHSEPAARAADVGTLAELAERLGTCRGDGVDPIGHGAPFEGAGASPECAHLVYVWSPSMPLSEKGIPEIREAARGLDMALSVVPETALIQSSGSEETESLRTDLVRAGATVHYPTALLFTAGSVRGPAIAGYKRAEAYESLLGKRLRAVADGTVRSAPGPGSTPRREAASTEILWTHTVRPPPGAFFRRVPGTTLISYDQRSAVYLRDLASDEAFRGPGWIDFVPSPDGRLFVSPGRRNSGLDFYLAREVLARGRAGEGADVEPFFTDPEMADQYPSVGVLETDDEGRPSRYRVLVSWFSGLAFRDYDVAWGDDGAATVTPATSKRTGCTGLDLSTPIMSKDGREIAARDDDTGTTKVFRMDDDGDCVEMLDIGRPTSKVGCSDDGRLIAYSSPERSRLFEGTRSHTWVLNRDEGRTLQVPDSESAGLVIPEVVGGDSLLIAVREEARSLSAEFRLICCVR
ncbi:MAG TPA: hypothetical protein VLL48_06700 [Longimicrobiales bacterium]|nr:hypothetical protein [Longimicrobiales bacterium]